MLYARTLTGHPPEKKTTISQLIYTSSLPFEAGSLGTIETRHFVARRPAKLAKEIAELSGVVFEEVSCHRSCVWIPAYEGALVLDQEHMTPLQIAAQTYAPQFCDRSISPV
jgi:hypothetical protein